MGKNETSKAKNLKKADLCRSGLKMKENRRKTPKMAVIGPKPDAKRAPLAPLDFWQNPPRKQEKLQSARISLVGAHGRRLCAGSSTANPHRPRKRNLMGSKAQNLQYALGFASGVVQKNL